MKQTYETPELTVVEFEAEDVITEYPGNTLPWDDQ